MAKTFLLLPGDGIGPEVIAEVRRVIDHLKAHAGLELEVDEKPYGGSAYDTHGTPLPEETRTAALASDAVLMGAVGGPQWASAPRHLRPEAALLTLRKDMDVFANLRPALCFDALAEASTLKREVVAGLMRGESDAKRVFLLAAVAEQLEQAADALLHASLMTGDYALGERLTG